MPEKTRIRNGAPAQNGAVRPGNRTLQRKKTNPGSAGKIPPIVPEVLSSPGQALDAQTRSFFEPRFGHDFSRVRVHTDEKAVQSAQAVDAFAYTVGTHVAFGPGQYQPGTFQGQQLLAHELTHVVQQDKGSGDAEYSILPEDSQAEREAAEASRWARNSDPKAIVHGMRPWRIGRAAKSGADTDGDSQWKTDLATFKEATEPKATSDSNKTTPSKEATRPKSGSPDSDKITAALLALLSDVAPSLAVSDLPLGPTVEPWVNPKLDLDWEGFVYEHLVLCYPDDAWKWIFVSPAIIQQTPAYTRTRLQHLFRQAADIHAAAKEFRKSSGPPPPAPFDACMPDWNPAGALDRVSGKPIYTRTPFAKYVGDFDDFYQKGFSRTPQLEIYASSATPDFEKLSPNEKLSWFTAMLTEVPAGVSAKSVLPTEPLVMDVFIKPAAQEEEMRTQFANELFRTARDFIYGNPRDKIAQDLGKAITLINHFNLVWNIHPTDRDLLMTAIRGEGKALPGMMPAPGPGEGLFPQPNVVPGAGPDPRTPPLDIGGKPVKEK